MNKKGFLAGLFFVVAFIMFFSCRKEPVYKNQLPVAVAGKDSIVLLPLDSFVLNGSASYDPDGNIVSFQWSKISGPSSYTIVNPNSATAILKNLTTGVYQFELRVSDNTGLNVADTVEITAVASGPNNHAPVAIAGMDKIVYLPNDFVVLDGELSHDIDNDITGYRWSIISEPSSVLIEKPDSKDTPVYFLFEGSFQFELKVTDATRLVDADTVIVNVVNVSCSIRPVINPRLVPIGSLSEGRIGLVSASANNKILFAGGMVSGGYSSRVDIYDITTNTWTTAELTQPERQGMAVATVGNKILFAGGGDNDNGATTTRVDIYDALNNTWSTAELSQGREYFAATTLGEKVFFAGGRTWQTSPSGFSTWAASSVVDIYDNASNTWTTATLSESRSDLSATTIDNKIYFAGGFSDQFQQIPTTALDIFDATTNSWSTSLLIEEKGAHTDIASGNKIFWASGIFNNNGLGPWPSNHVEIRDVKTNQTSFACITGKLWARAVLKNDDIIFFPGSMGNGMVSGNEFDIFNITTGQWSTARLNQEVYDGTIISVNNTIYVAGGRDQSWGPYFKEVWKLEY